jgi:hypothetical protein
LIEQFGTEYLEYKKTTRGLIPFIYWWLNLFFVRLLG